MNDLATSSKTQRRRQTASKCAILASVALGFAANIAFATAPTQSGSTNSEIGLLNVLCAIGALTTIAGTALYFGALVRSKNTLSAMAQVLVGASVAFVTWFLWAGDFALSAPGTSWLNLAIPSFNQNQGSAGQQMTLYPLIILAGCLLFGGVVERFRLRAVILFTVLWISLVAAPIMRAVQSVGLLGGLGYADWLGAGSIHVSVGLSVLLLSAATGARRGYGRIPLPPYHLGLGFVGALIMVLGWITALVAGGLNALNSPGNSAALSLLAGTLGGVLAWVALERLRGQLVSTLGMASGAIAGAVACSTCAAWLSPRTAILVGVAGAASGFLGAVSIRRLRNLDDSMDVFSLHALPAAAGLLLLPIFGPTSATFGQQLAGVLVTSAYTLVLTAAIAFPMKFFGLLRVSFDDEDAGLDLTVHGETVHPPQSTL